MPWKIRFQPASCCTSPQNDGISLQETHEDVFKKLSRLHRDYSDAAFAHEHELAGSAECNGGTRTRKTGRKRKGVKRRVALRKKVSGSASLLR